jgi:enoyl-CoA hydratase/carnithine racemase
MDEILEVTQQGRVLRLALNRPGKRNALNAELCRELVRSIEDAAADHSVGSILLTANGTAFCAGMDLQEIGAVSSTEAINQAQEFLFTLGASLSKPLIAAVRGAALGGGTGLVANCHIVVASEDALFGLTEIRLGLWPFLVFRSLVAALGERRTVELALTGRTFAAAEAKEIWLIQEISPDPEARAAEIAAEVAAFSPTAILSGMTFVQEARGLDWRTGGEIARRIRDEVFRSEDFREGLRAFHEKRPPKWPSLRR